MPFNFAPQDNFGSGLAKGAESALQNFIMPGMQAREQSKLALQMLNARIDKEQQAKQGEMTFASGLQTVPQDEMQNIQSQIGNVLTAAQQHKPIPTLDSSGIKTAQGQQMYLKQFGDVTQALAQQARMDKPVVHMTTDPITGKQTYVGVDPFSGHQTWEAEGGTGASTAKAIQGARSTYFKIANTADTLENRITQLANSQGPLQAALQAGSLTLGQLASSDPASKALMDQLPFMGMSLDKTMLGGLPRAQKMQASGAEYQFTPNDTVQPRGAQHPGSFNLKMNNMRQFGYDGAKATYASVGRLPDSDIQDPNANGATPPSSQSKNPVDSGFAAWKAAKYGQGQAK